MRNRSLVAGISQRRGAIRQVATGACIAIATVLASSAPASAQDDTHVNTFEFTPFLGLMTGGSFEDPANGAERDIEGDMSYGLVVNLAADVPERQYELLYAKQGTAVEGTVPFDLDVEYLQIGGHVAYPQSKHVIPYFGLTVGAARFSPDQAGLDDETKFSMSVGTGVKVPLTDRFGIRFDVRAFISFLQNDSQIFCVFDPAVPSACAVRPKSDTLVQYTGSLGFSVGF